MSRINRRSFCVATAASLATGTATAQGAWPSRQITMIVPFATAGSNDIIARIIANELTQSLKVPVIVDNKPGAGGMLGAGIVAKAASDGYTLMLGSSSLTVGGALKSGLPFDPRNDLTPIALAASGPTMLVASQKVAAKTPAELIALAKANPGKLSYGSSGIGSLPHLGMELFASAAGVQLLHVPYKGGAPILNDMLGGQIDLYLGSMPQVLPMVRSGKIKAIGITSAERFALVPDIPTMRSVVPFTFDLWWGIYGPGNLPKDIVTRLNTEIRKALASDAMKKFSETEGVTPGLSTTADQFAKIYLDEIRGWETLNKKLNLKLE